MERMNQENLIKTIKDVMNALRDKRKLGKASDADFLLEGQIADYLKLINQYP